MFRVRRKMGNVGRNAKEGKANGKLEMEYKGG